MSFFKTCLQYETCQEVFLNIRQSDVLFPPAQGFPAPVRVHLLENLDDLLVELDMGESPIFVAPSFAGADRKAGLKSVNSLGWRPLSKNVPGLQHMRCCGA